MGESEIHIDEMINDIRALRRFFRHTPECNN